MGGSQQCLKFRNVSALGKAKSPLVFFGAGDGNEVSLTFTTVTMHVYNVDFKNSETRTALPGCGSAESRSRGAPALPEGAHTQVRTVLSERKAGFLVRDVSEGAGRGCSRPHSTRPVLVSDLFFNRHSLGRVAPVHRAPSVFLEEELRPAWRSQQARASGLRAPRQQPKTQNTCGVAGQFLELHLSPQTLFPGFVHQGVSHQ